MPTATRFLPPGTNLRELTGELPVSMKINQRILGEPAFKRFMPEWVDRYIEDVHKVAENYKELHAEKKKRTKSWRNSSNSPQKLIY